MDGTVNPPEDGIVFRPVQELALFLVRLERAEFFYQFRLLFRFVGHKNQLGDVTRVGSSRRCDCQPQIDRAGHSLAGSVEGG